MSPRAQLWGRAATPSRGTAIKWKGVLVMTLKKILLGTALAAAFAGTADAAASNRGWYVGVEAGANWVQDVDDHFTIANNPVTTLNVDVDTGWAAIATVGYAFWESNWRLELEGA